MPLLRTFLLNATLGMAGYWAARHGLRMPAGLPRGLAAFTIAWAWATMGMEILGPVGFLTYVPLLAWSAIGLAIGTFLRWRDADAGVRAETEGLGPRRGWEMSATLALGVVAWVTIVHGLISMFGPVKVMSDGPIYHLYFAARWWKAGRLFLVAAPFGESVVTYFPAVGDLWFTWLMVGWDGELLAKVGQLPFLLVAALAAFAAARRLGAGVSASVIATSWFVTIVPLFIFTLEPNVDTIFVAGYLLAAYFFLRYALGDEPSSDLIIGALAIGGVLGTKPTGFVFGGLLLAGMTLVVMIRRTTMPRAVGHMALLGLLPMVMVGSWYGRNAWLTGNPLYPLHLSAFGRVWLSGWYGADVMRMSPYHLPVGDWRSLIDIVLAVFDPRLAPFWLLALVGAWSPGRRRPRVWAWGWAFSATALANLATYWLLVPYRTQQRFMFQAAGLMMIPLAFLFDRGPWIRRLAAGLLVVHVFTAQGWPFCPADQDPPWDLSPVVPNIVPPLLVFPLLSRWNRGLIPDPDDFSWTLVMLSIGAGSLAWAWLWSRPKGHAIARTVTTLVALLALSLTLAVAYASRSDPRATFFPNFPQYRTGWLQLDARAGPSGSRVAYAGTNLPYYLMGVGLRNEVRYVNVDAHRGWLMHDYHRLAKSRGEPTWPNPWPTWDRLRPDYDAWMANLREEAIELLVVASMGRPAGSLPDADPEGFPIERRWAESHPESFEPLYGVAENDPWFRIYRVVGSRPGRVPVVSSGDRTRP